MALGRIARFRVVASQERFHLLTRFDAALIERIDAVIADGRSDYWHLKLPAQVDILLVGVHGYDIKNYTPDEREMFFARIAANIRFIEESRTGHKRTVVFGDFNANPFDAVVGSLRGLHAIPIPAVAGKDSRPFENQEHEFFYNPMWAKFGGNGEPPATHYYYKYKPHEIFWHMLDQVVLRPAILPLFREAELKIIGEVAGTSLLKKNGTPDRKLGSDHLPLFFRLDLEKVATNA